MIARRLRVLFAFVLMAATGSPSALAQPSITRLPGDGRISDLTPFSPDGTKIAGMQENIDGFAYDIPSNVIRYVPLFSSYFSPSVIFDSGFVYGTHSTNLGSYIPSRWNPVTGAFVDSQPAGLDPEAIITLADVSPDGRVGTGNIRLPGQSALPFRYDFVGAAPGLGDRLTVLPTGSTPLPVNGVFVRQRGEGLYDIWGQGAFLPLTGQTVTWPLNSLGDPLRVQPDGFLTGLSADGSVRLQLAQLVVNGTPIPLQPLPNFPTVEARGLSADGRVAVGVSIGQNSRRKWVMWRDGGEAEDVLAVLAQAGVPPPSAATDYPDLYTRVSNDGTRLAVILPSFGSTSGPAFVATIPPKNDGCVRARPVSFGVYRDSLRGATSSVSSNVCFSDANAPDVWYAFTPAANEIVRLDTCGSDFDTTITVYRGTAGSCGTNFPPIVCSNDSNTTFCPQNTATSVVDFSAQIGSVYYIRLAGNFGQRGSAVLSITPPARPVNDSCGGALPLDAGFSREFDTSNATTDSRPGCPGSPLPFFDLWYRTVAPDTGRMTFTTCGSQGNFVVAVYGEDACGNPGAAPIDCSNTVGCPGLGGVMTVSAARNQVFYVRVGGAFGTQGPGGRVSAFYSCDSNQLTEYTLAVLAAQPSFHHRFEEPGSTTAADAVRRDAFSCGNYPGQYSSVLKVPGVLGNGILLNFFDPFAGDRRIFAPANLGDATLEAWIKTTNPFAGDIIQSRGAESEFGLALTLGAQREGELAFTNEGPGGFSFGARSLMNVADGRWRHVVGTRRNIIPGLGTIHQYLLWVDGELVASSSTFDGRSQVGSNADGPWVIGNRNINPNAFNIFNGGPIDEVAVYPSAQSGQQIGDRYLIATRGCTPLISNRRLIGPTTFVNPDVPLTISMDARSTRLISYQWETTFPNGIVEVLADGGRADGSTVSGARTATLSIQNVSFPQWENARLTGRAITDCGEQVVATVLDLPGSCACGADLNCDGNLDPDDLSDYITCYFGTDASCPRFRSRDFNGDGRVDPDDLADFITAYFGGC